MATLQEFIELLDQTKNNTAHAVTMLGYYPELTKYYTVRLDPGQKFDRLVKVCNVPNNGGGYVMYFVEKSTGNIYGAESFKKPNYKRQYGNLTTIHEWDWIPYYAISLKGVDTLVPKDQRIK